MGEFADLKIRRSAAIYLADDRLRRGITDVVKPGFDGNFGGRLREIAEAEEIGVSGGINPDGRLQLGGDAGSLRRIEAGARNFENAGELKVVADNLGEEGSVGLGGVSAGGEVGDGDARFVGIHADCSAKPILC
jgi:hypothetical protein